MNWLLTIIMFSVSSYAQDLMSPVRSEPSWVKVKPKSDDVAVYYVGRGSDKDESLAYQIAVRDAYSKFVRDNFKITTKLNSELKTDLKSASFDQFNSESSEEVITEGLKNEDEWKTTSDEKTDYFLLFRITHKDIDRTKALNDEKDSIKKKLLAATRAKIGFGNATDEGTLSLISNPPKMEVHIDGLRMASTPVTLFLKIGKHKISIKDPDNKLASIDKEINVNAKSPEELYFTLTPKKVELVINVEPAIGTKIFINGKPFGFPPVKTEAAIGSKLEIIAQNEECEEVKQLKEVESASSIILPLTYRKARLLVVVDPANAEIYEDGKKIGESGSKIDGLERGTHNFVIKKTGYEDYPFKVDLKGGEKRTTETYHLALISEAKQREIEEQKESEKRELEQWLQAGKERKIKANNEAIAYEQELKDRYLDSITPPSRFTWGLFFSGGTISGFKVPSDVSGMCCGGTEFSWSTRLFDSVGLSFIYRFGFGFFFKDKNTSSKSQSASQWHNDLSIGLPIYFGIEKLRFLPTFGVSNTIIGRGDGDLVLPSSQSINQILYGVGFTYLFPLQKEKDDFYMSIYVRNHTSYGSIVPSGIDWLYSLGWSFR